MPEDVTGNDVRLSVRSIKEIGHDSTTEGRIAKDASIRVAYHEQKRIAEVLRLAEILAKKEGRKTVKEEDVRTVYQMLEAEVPV